MHYSLINTLDISGSLLSLVSTFYYIRAKNCAWPIALFSIGINIFLYLLIGLYADTGKEIIYFISSLYGWYWWAYGGGDKKTVPIRNITAKHATILFTAAALSFCMLSQCLIHFTHSKVPYWDALTTTLSFTAQWLVCRKIITTWLMWFIVDGLYTGLYFYKGIPVHAVTFGIYMVVAIFAHFHWKKLMRSQPETQSLDTKNRSYKSDSAVPDSG